MNYHASGRSNGLTVSRLCLGAMMFGDRQHKRRREQGAVMQRPG